jgi:predicted transcriptional regulator
MSAATQERSKGNAGQMIQEVALDGLRGVLDLTQEHLAELLHVNHAAICKVERRSDMYISRLRKIIEAMGGHLDIRAVLPNGVVRINQFEEVRKARSQG